MSGFPHFYVDADAWIVDQVKRDDVVITSHIPLAARCLKTGVRVVKP
jgi:uncharacterized protein YaiI (UPF0178 family)